MATFRDIDFEDIPRALKLAGSNRRTVDRNDYVKVLRELGDAHRQVDDFDISEALIGIGGGIMPVVFKKFPSVVGIANQTLFKPTGGAVWATACVKVLQTLLAPADATLKVGFDAYDSAFIGFTNMNGSNFTTGEFVVGNTSDMGYAGNYIMGFGTFFEVGNDIKLYKAGSPMTSGGMNVTAFWFPVDEGATLVAV